MLTKRAGKSTYSLVSLLNESPAGLCLQQKFGRFGLFGTDRIEMGSCGKNSARSWDFEFLDQKHVKLSNNGKCVVRGRTLKSAASLVNCKSGEYTALVYHPANVHKNGFYLKSADGNCFDGTMFKRCSVLSMQGGLLWGIGVRYASWSGRESRYIFDFHDRTKCLVATGGSKIEKGDCSSGAATGWSLENGRLSRGATGGGPGSAVCVSRRADDTALMTNCKEANEFIALELPLTYS
jgi:hypothetical protein